MKRTGFSPQFMNLAQPKIRRRMLVLLKRHLVAALIVGEHPADKHRIQEAAAFGDLSEVWIVLHDIGTHRVRGVKRLARRDDVARPPREI